MEFYSAHSDEIIGDHEDIHFDDERPPPRLQSLSDFDGQCGGRSGGGGGLYSGGGSGLISFVLKQF